jgi:putative MATE family efflux protein
MDESDTPINAHDQDERIRYMTTAPVEKLVISLGVPSVIIMMVSGIYNMADTYFVSSLGTSAVASVGVVFPLMAIIQALGFFFGQGSGNYISRELGAQHFDKASQMAVTGFLSALILAVALSITGNFFIEPLCRALGSTATILPYAKSYMRFILIGMPWMIGSLVLNNQLRFQGSSFYAMVGVISGAILNILLDPLFIFAFHLGVMGASLATAISQFVGCGILLSGCARKGNIHIHPKYFSPSQGCYREIVRGGFPSLLRQGLGSAAAVLINHLAGFYGDAAIAAISIVNRVTMFAAAAVMGLGQGFQPVCGFNYGAGRYDRVKKAFWFCVKLSTAMLVVAAALLAVFAPGIIALFRKDDPEVVAIGTRYLRLHSVSIPLFGFIITSNMLMQTTGKAFKASLLALARQGLFLIPFLIIFTPLFGLLGIQLSQPVSDIAAFFFTLFLMLKVLRKELNANPAPDYTVPMDRINDRDIL